MTRGVRAGFGLQSLGRGPRAALPCCLRVFLGSAVGAGLTDAAEEGAMASAGDAGRWAELAGLEAAQSSCTCGHASDVEEFIGIAFMNVHGCSKRAADGKP
jgi:hypothetical protein